LSTIHGRYVCKDRERTITILAIQSKKAACERFSKQMKWDAYNYLPISAQSMIRKMFSLTRYFPMYIGWLAERSSLAAKNMNDNELNIKIQNLLPGD
jgi:hypothetical protein